VKEKPKLEHGPPCPTRKKTERRKFANFQFGFMTCLNSFTRSIGKILEKFIFITILLFQSFDFLPTFSSKSHQGCGFLQR